MVRTLQDVDPEDWDGSYRGRWRSLLGQSNAILSSLLHLITIKSFQVDIDEHNDLAFEFDVSSVPVLVGMKNGVEVARMVGLQDKDKLKKFVEIIAKSK